MDAGKTVLCDKSDMQLYKALSSAPGSILLILIMLN